MAEQTKSNYMRLPDALARLTWRGIRLAEAGLNVPFTVGKLALDVSVQVAETARAAGLPVPEPYVIRVRKWAEERERSHHERTAYYLGSLYLKALVQQQRDQPYAVQPDAVLEVLEGFCEETDVDIAAVMDPHAGGVVKGFLGNRPAD